jgi:hypothetical protein
MLLTKPLNGISTDWPSLAVWADFTTAFGLDRAVEAWPPPTSAFPRQYPRYIVKRTLSSLGISASEAASER